MKNEDLKNTLKETSSLSGSIFAVTGKEVEENIHWKRKLAIRLYPMVLLLTDMLLIFLIFALASNHSLSS